jgi:predicted MFS family arabinose efflux permease
MLPPGLLRRRNVLVGNLETVGVYAALSIVLFLLALFLQEVGSLSATEAGLATLPTTVPLMLLSRRFGALADRIGPRLLMGAGPLVMAVGLLLMLRVERDVALVGAVLPSLFVFGVGFAMTVAPLTATVLGGADAGQAGIASAVNNAVARIAGLTGIAALGPLLGARLDVPSFRTGILAAATLTAVAGAIGALFLRDRLRGVRAEECPGGAVMGAPVAVAAAGHPGRDQGARGREPVLAAGSWSAR